jgi:hypothetical protein
MDLGIRQIRTAGKGSGSIELTLPAELRDLVGLPCRILLSDGSRPDIVLQPDLRQARDIFASIWNAMASALLPLDGGREGRGHLPELPLSAFSFALQPRSPNGERPFLSWRDGLALAAAAPHDPQAVSRTIAALGQALAGKLDIDPAFAGGFGAACGFLLAGVATSSDEQEARDLVADALRPHIVPDRTAEACACGIMSDVFWHYATPKLSAIAEVFLGWNADPAGHAALRAAWRRGRAIEMSGG